ncbi:hypothetical protein [Clostridium cochlearium]|nr:hypothetical protein [Clostridium cochlearium]SQB34467.1 Uncharacterised protein [Clostridium cochlearium]
MCFFILFIQNHHFYKNNDTMTIPTIKDVSTFENKITKPIKNILPNEKNLQGYGIRLFDSNGNFIKSDSITYENKMMSYYISFVNANPYNDSIGFMIIIDGQIQPFFVDGKNNSKVIHNEKLEPYSLINVPVKFNPIINNINKNHTICFLSIFNQDLVPNSDIKYVDYYTAPYTFKLNIPKNLNIYLANEINNNISKLNYSYVSQSESNKWTGINKNGTIKPFTQNNQLTFNKSNKNDTFTFGAVLPEGLYSTIIFVDNKPIEIFNGMKNITWKSKKDTMVSFPFLLKNSLTKGQHQIYSITIPLSDNINEEIFESSKISITILD